ncbi:hypothetical protein CFAM422_012586 [Trichoderma lentiforme]|uniref:Uncharacterized protein n=1 Tax=Trichoderma lentiforme TaxID=1567552 RepID=A0A9P5C846_9HYPO|nr:hypothetical protein CFAM422_012586 [Trichoderma lentiforme]
MRVFRKLHVIRRYSVKEAKGRDLLPPFPPYAHGVANQPLERAVRYVDSMPKSGYASQNEVGLQYS